MNKQDEYQERTVDDPAVNSKISSLPESLPRIILLVFAAVGLFYFAYLGIFTRYWQDDYCYNADFQRLGLIGTLKGYTYITTYASNRLSLTFFSGLFYYLGVLGAEILRHWSSSCGSFSLMGSSIV
jgi:hypothetical protein